MVSFVNRVRVNTATTGTGTVTLGSATSTAYATAAEAGLANGSTVTYLIEDTFTSGVPADFEIGTGVYTASGTTLTRAAVLLSKISGTSGTTKLTLSGSAVVSIIASAEDLAAFHTGTLSVASGGTGQTTEAEALGEMLQALTEDTAPSLGDYLLTYDASADTGKKVALSTLNGLIQATGNTTFYVRTDGSDSNDGLTDNAGGAFLTVQKALNNLHIYDWGAYTPTIQIRTGTYNVGSEAVGRALPDSFEGTVTIVGDTTTPTNVVLTGTGDTLKFFGGSWSVRGLKLISTSAGSCLTSFGATISAGYIYFGQSPDNCITMGGGELRWNFGESLHIDAANNNSRGFIRADEAHVVIEDIVITIDSAFPMAATGFHGFIYLFNNSLMYMGGTTFTNPSNVTGRQYNVRMGSSFFGSGSVTLDSLPGTTAGVRDATAYEGFATNTAFNSVRVADALTTAKPKISAGGVDTNISLDLQPKGSGSIVVLDGSGNEQLSFVQTSTAVNYLTITNAATGTGPTIATEGDDTNVPLTINCQATGADSTALTFNLGDSFNNPNVVFATANGGSTGMTVLFDQNGTTPVAGDVITSMLFQSKDSGAANQNYCYVDAGIVDTTAAAESGFVSIGTVLSGSSAYRMQIGAGVIIGSTSVYPGAGSLRVTGIELGHDTDTTLTRSAAGTLAVEGVAVAMAGKQTIWVPASAMTPAATNGAAPTTRAINTITTGFLAFDQTTSESAYFNVAFPKSWNEGTVTAQVFWTTTGGAAAETLEFEISGGCFANDAAINVTGLGTAVAHTDTWIADDDVHVTAEGGAITLSSAAVDTVAWFRIVRDVANDTLTADAELIGVKLFYTTDAGTDA